MVENITEAMETFKSIESVSAIPSERSDADLCIGVYDEGDIGKFFGKQRRENVNRVHAERDSIAGSAKLYAWLSIE